MHRLRHSRVSSRPDRSGQGFAICVTLFALAAMIPQGSVGFLESRLVAALAWLLGVGGIVWAIRRGANAPSLSSRLAIGAGAWLATWCAVQLLPFAGGWANQIWRGDAALLNEIMADSGGWSIALDRFVSLQVALLWAGLGTLSWACSLWLRGRGARTTVLCGLAALGSVQAILGIFILKDPGGRITGTFGSPNALGGLLAITLPVTLGLALFQSSPRTLRGRTGFRWWIHRLGDSWTIWFRLLSWAAWGIQWVALYVTGSIGSTLAAAAACGALLVWQAKERPEARHVLGAMGVGLVLLVLAFSIHARNLNVLDRALGEDETFQRSTVSRVEIWDAARQLCQAFPHGTGPGGAAMALPMFQSGAYGHFRLNYAHNDTLQFLGDLGWVGLVALVFLLGLVLWRGARGCGGGASQGAEPAWLIRGAWLGTVAALLHAQVEFNLSARPGIQVVFAVLCGILWGAPSAHSPMPDHPLQAAPSGWRSRILPLVLLTLASVSIGLCLSAAWAWRLHEGASAAAGLSLDRYFWFRRPVFEADRAPEALRLACRLAPRSSRLRRTSAEMRLVMHDRRVERVARSILISDGTVMADDLPLDPAIPAHQQALTQADLALRLDELEVLRAAADDADSSVRLAPWDASARLTRGAILLRGAALNSFGLDAVKRGRRDLEIATALYPMDASVLAGACSALSKEVGSDRDAETLVDWGARALELDASHSWTVLDAWWMGHVPISRVLALPHLPIAVLWNLYIRLDKLNRTDDAQRCLIAMERRLEGDRPPETSLLWAPATWKRWNIQQSQYRIRLATEWLKRHLQDGNWDAVTSSAAARAQARHDRFQIELDKMELSGAASVVLRRLRLREWAAAGRLTPDWTLEWALLELEAALPVRHVQEPLAEMILMNELAVGGLERLRVHRPELSDSPLLLALLAAMEAEAAGRLEEAIASLDSSLRAGLVPTGLVHRAWLWQSRLLRQSGREPEAEEAVREAARICPSDPDVESARMAMGANPGTTSAHGTPALDLGYAGGRLQLEHVRLKRPEDRTDKPSLQLHWRFLGRLPPDLRIEVLIRDGDGFVRASKSVVLDQEKDARFNRGNPAVGSTWAWAVPVSSFAVQGQTVEVRLRAGGKWLPADDGLAVIKLNVEKLPPAEAPLDRGDETMLRRRGPQAELDSASAAGYGNPTVASERNPADDRNHD